MSAERMVVEGREATLVRLGKVTLSPLVFDLEHEHARRIQLVRTGQREFEVRIDSADKAAIRVTFQDVIKSVKRVFCDNGLDDVVLRKSEALPNFIASRKVP
ncbi:MAG: hypothetical protein ACR2PF_20035 [Rhizobiaceae bacterium]